MRTRSLRWFEKEGWEKVDTRHSSAAGIRATEEAMIGGDGDGDGEKEGFKLGIHGGKKGNGKQRRMFSKNEKDERNGMA